MEIADLVSLGGISDALKAASKKQALQELSAVAAACRRSRTKSAILNILLARERLGSTGVGRGVAIPHGQAPRPRHAPFGGVRPPVGARSISTRLTGGRSTSIFLLLAPEYGRLGPSEGAGAGLAPAARRARPAPACARRTARRRSTPSSPVPQAPPGRERPSPAVWPAAGRERLRGGRGPPHGAGPRELRRPGRQRRAAAGRPRQPASPTSRFA